MNDSEEAISEGKNNPNGSDGKALQNREEASPKGNSVGRETGTW
jgi:hypothetical protein